MKYTKLGSTDIDISRICLGTMTWGQQNSESEGFEQMNYALTQGVNFWDTAEMYAFPRTPETYGKTEKIIGNWFAKHQRRQEVILATKFSPVTYIRNEQNPVTNKPNIIEAVNNSLQRLKTDYIDLYKFHWPTNRAHYHFNNWWDFEPDSNSNNKLKITNNIVEILETCDELIKAGKIRHIGISNDSAWGICQFLKIAEKYKDVLIHNEIEWEEEGHTESKILNADLVVKSPGIPEQTPIIKLLRTKAITLLSEIEFGALHTTANIIGITGSN